MNLDTINLLKECNAGCKSATNSMEQVLPYVKDEKLMFDIIRNSFNMRRKTLWNGIKFLGLPKENLELAFEKAGIDPKRRGETLSLEEFAKLADEIYNIK